MAATLLLKPMNQAQFDAFVEDCTEEYARTSPHFRNLPFSEAIVAVQKDFQKKIAPQGLETEGHYFMAIFRGEQPIGYLHLGEFPRGTPSLYGWDFKIYKEFRKQGYGRQAMEASKVYFKQLGYKKISLNVIAENQAAIELYEKFGFKVTEFSMGAEID